MRKNLKRKTTKVGLNAVFLAQSLECWDYKHVTMPDKVPSSSQTV